MAAHITQTSVQLLEIVKEETIAASIDLVFAAVLEQLGPENEAPGTGRIPMILEPWPGGRWFRDLGNDTGHFWGNVQAIRPPTLLEICGPLFMSYPAVSNVQFRLAEDRDVTRLRFAHRAMGHVGPDQRIDDVWGQIESGWSNLIARISTASQRLRR